MGCSPSPLQPDEEDDTQRIIIHGRTGVALKKCGVFKERTLDCKNQEALQKDKGMPDRAYEIRGFRQVVNGGRAFQAVRTQ